MTTRYADHVLSGTTAARPAASSVPVGTIYASSTDGVVYQSNGSSWGTWLASSTGIPASTIDAKGDLLAGTANDTISRLAVGSDGQVLTADSSQTTGIKWAAAGGGGGGVTVLSYVEFTSSVAISASGEATADTVVTAASQTVSGSTLICVEFYCPNVTLPASSSGQLIILLAQGGSSIGRLAQLMSASSSATQGPSVFARRYFTPSAGTYVWSVRAWSYSGGSTISAGAGGSGNLFPGYIRVTSGG